MASGLEYPPLLPLGFHEMAVSDLRTLCVARFPDSLTRQGIMDGFEQVLDELNQKAMPMEIWVDGSFVTEKLNPADVDVVAKVDGKDYDASTQAQRDVLKWLVGTDLRQQFMCHSFAFVQYEPGHLLAAEGEWWRAYWLRQFGFNRNNEPRGLPVLRTPFLIA